MYECWKHDWMNSHAIEYVGRVLRFGFLTGGEIFRFYTWILMHFLAVGMHRQAMPSSQQPLMVGCGCFELGLFVGGYFAFMYVVIR